MPSSNDKPKPQGIGLGRGLDALFSTAETAGTDSSDGAQGVGNNLVEIPVLNLRPNSQQPRQDFDQDEINALADSIRLSGLLQPLVVQLDPEVPENYLIISGERRWRASQLAGLLSVPAIVREASSQEALVLALVENLQRSDLSSLEQARAFLRLSTHHDLTHAQIANAMGISRSAVTNAIRLLSLPDSVQRALVNGEITVGHARAILSWPTPDDQSQALRKILADGLSVRQTEDVFLRGLQSPSSRSVAKPTETETKKDSDTENELSLLERRLREHLRTKVSIQRSSSGAGKLVLHFYDDASFNHLTETLLPKSEDL